MLALMPLLGGVVFACFVTAGIFFVDRHRWDWSEAKQAFVLLGFIWGGAAFIVLATLAVKAWV